MDEATKLDLLRIASSNVCDGIHYEPRIYFTDFSFVGQTTVTSVMGQPDVYRNGEGFNVRITHILAALQGPEVGGVNDERFIQQYGLRIRAHDTFYMNPVYIPFPLWHNQLATAVDVVTQGQSSWKFEKPFIMGKRDSFTVKAALNAATGGSATRNVAVSFSGVGQYSRRPKQLYSDFTFNNANGVSTQELPSDQLRNTGAEPLEIHEMSVSVGALSTATNPAGDIRLANISVRLNGNGTNQRWTIGNPNTDSLVPATLWGLSTGRAVVHKLPDNGWLWRPGQGVNLEVSNLTARADTVNVALVGYAIIT